MWCVLRVSVRVWCVCVRELSVLLADPGSVGIDIMY